VGNSKDEEYCLKIPTDKSKAEMTLSVGAFESSDQNAKGTESTRRGGEGWCEGSITFQKALKKWRPGGQETRKKLLSQNKTGTHSRE